MLVDSHCHLDTLDLTLFDNNLDNVLAAARQQQVEHFLCVCIDLENFPKVLEIAKHYPNVYASVGLHPNSQVATEPTAAQLIDLAQDPAIIAIGETGLDYFRSEGDLDWQRERFRRHIQAAKAVKKPLIIHSRDAEADTLKIMQEAATYNVKGVLHCFTGSLAMAEAAIAMGFYISFSGILTFKNATQLHEVAKRIPLDSILIETDCPYLAPMPHRGKPNQPAYVRYVAEALADLRQIPYAKIAEATTANFFQCFPLAADNRLESNK